MLMRRALSIWIPVNRQWTITVNWLISFFWQIFSETTSIARRFSGGILGGSQSKTIGLLTCQDLDLESDGFGKGSFLSGFPDIPRYKSRVDEVFASGCVLWGHAIHGLHPRLPTRPSLK